MAAFFDTYLSTREAGPDLFQGDMKPARVIGAGLSGLAAAWHLADRGFAVTVIEQSSRPGGLIQTTTDRTRPRRNRRQRVRVERRPWRRGFSAWTSRLSFRSRRASAATSFATAAPRRWPLTAVESIGLAARFGTAFVTRTTSAGEQETMEAWGDRVIGAAATRWLLEPAMQGIYASPPGALSARAIFDGRTPRSATGSWRRAGGMGQFTTRLYERLRDRGVRFQFNTSAATIDAGVPTVVCTAAPAAARLVAPHAPDGGSAIGRIRMAALTTVTMFFEPHPDGHARFWDPVSVGNRHQRARRAA